MSLPTSYCYAQEDKKLRDALDKHLTPLRQSGLIAAPYNHEIQAGMDWVQEIMPDKAAPHIILFLISADFISSEYCYGKEMRTILELHQIGQMCAIPIYMRSVNLHETPFERLQILPSRTKPVDSPSRCERDKALREVAEGIRKAVKALLHLAPT